MKVYTQPQAHHWVAMRLIRSCLKHTPPIVTTDVAKSITWLVREVGRSTLNEMIDQLQYEEDHKSDAARFSELSNQLKD